jgi:Protein of unknown function (DUF2752)
MASEEKAVDLETYEVEEESADDARPIRYWIRAILLGLTVPWIAVLIVAISLDPYEENGEARKLGTHQQLGLPECTFKAIVGVPCPSCGMTTSFSLMMHADVWNSMKANFAGTALVTFGLLFIPWAFASAFLGRLVFIRSLEMVIFRLAIIFLVLLFGRWAIVIVLEWLNK